MARRPAPRAGGARRPRRARGERRGDGAVAHRGRRAGHAAHARACSTATSAGAPASWRRPAPTTRRAGSSATCAGCTRRCRRRTASGPRSRWPTTRSRARRCSTPRPRRSRTRCSTSPGGTPRSPATSASRPIAAPAPRAHRLGVRARSTATGPSLASGCIDAMAEQLVAGADQAGDVLVLLGTTLIVWVVAHEGAEVPGYVTIPHTASGNYLVGGPSNAGGLFRDWATRFLARRRRTARSTRARCRCGRRTRAASACRSTTTPGVRRCNDLDLTHDAAAIVRADRRGVGVRGEARDRRRGRARGRAAEAGRRVRWRHARRRVGAGHRRRHRPPGRLRRRARGWRARLGVAGPHRRRARGADGDDRGSPLGAGRTAGRTARRRGPRRRPDATRSSSRSAELPHEGGGSTTRSPGKIEVQVARREPVAVAVAHAHPVGRDLGVARPRRGARPLVTASRRAASSQRLSPGRRRRPRRRRRRRRAPAAPGAGVAGGGGSGRGRCEATVAVVSGGSAAMPPWPSRTTRHAGGVAVAAGAGGARRRPERREHHRRRHRHRARGVDGPAHRGERRPAHRAHRRRHPARRGHDVERAWTTSEPGGADAARPSGAAPRRRCAESPSRSHGPRWPNGHARAPAGARSPPGRRPPPPRPGPYR